MLARIEFKLHSSLTGLHSPSFFWDTSQTMKRISPQSIYEAATILRYRLREATKHPSLQQDGWASRQLADFTIWATAVGAFDDEGSPSSLDSIFALQKCGEGVISGSELESIILWIEIAIVGVDNRKSQVILLSILGSINYNYSIGDAIYNQIQGYKSHQREGFYSDTVRRGDGRKSDSFFGRGWLWVLG
jgi:hypothetical protein